MSTNEILNSSGLAGIIIGCLISFILIGILLELSLFRFLRKRRHRAETKFLYLMRTFRGKAEGTRGIIRTDDRDLPSFENAGLNYFYEANRELQKRLTDKLGSIMTVDFAINLSVGAKKQAHETAKAIYARFYEQHLPQLSTYFAHLYDVLNFVDTASYLSKAQKTECIDTLQEQMSDAEQQLLFYHGVGASDDMLYTFIEKYDLLRAVNSVGLIEFLSEFYPKSCFRE